jgi:hypothetical protein
MKFFFEDEIAGSSDMDAITIRSEPKKEYREI